LAANAVSQLKGKVIKIDRAGKISDKARAMQRHMATKNADQTR
jgi:hypothetical protein